MRQLYGRLRKLQLCPDAPEGVDPNGEIVIDEEVCTDIVFADSEIWRVAHEQLTKAIELREGASGSKRRSRKAANRNKRR